MGATSSTSARRSGSRWGSRRSGGAAAAPCRDLTRCAPPVHIYLHHLAHTTLPQPPPLSTHHSDRAFAALTCRVRSLYLAAPRSLVSTRQGGGAGGGTGGRWCRLACRVRGLLADVVGGCRSGATALSSRLTPPSGAVVRGRGAAVFLSDTMHLLIRFGKSTPPRNRQSMF